MTNPHNIIFIGPVEYIRQRAERCVPDSNGRWQRQLPQIVTRAEQLMGMHDVVLVLMHAHELSDWRAIDDQLDRMLAHHDINALYHMI